MRPVVLQTLPNPSAMTYRVRSETEDLTWFGARRDEGKQPDYGKCVVTYEPGEYIVELKSLKFWFESFRDGLFSYERLVTTMFDEFADAVRPTYLRIEVHCHPRGGTKTTVMAEDEADSLDDHVMPSRAYTDTRRAEMGQQSVPTRVPGA